MSKSNLESFVDQFVALVKGDDAAVQAEKTIRQAQSALSSHISSYEGDTIDLEDKLSTAKEELSNSRVNHGELITDRASYVRRLILSKELVLDAEEELAAHKDKIEFLKQELKAIK